MKPENAGARARHWIGVLIAVPIVILALIVLWHSFQTLRLEAIGQAVARLSPRSVLLCALLTGVSFVVLGFYDAIAVRVVAPKRVSAWLAWWAGMVANAISNTLGFHAVTGTAVRYRLYRGAGLPAADIARVSSLSWTALGFGFVSMFALALMFSAGAGNLQHLAGFAVLASMAVLAWWMGEGRTLALGRMSLPLPSTGLALAQMVLGAIEMLAAIGALYVLMPPGGAISFVSFSAIYVGAVLLGIASHAPGGIGVFEATILGLAHQGDRAGVLGALLLYRLIYNLLPFGLAVSTVAVHELVVRKFQLERG